MRIKKDYIKGLKTKDLDKISAVIRHVFIYHIGEDNKVSREDLRAEIVAEYKSTYRDPINLSDRKMRDLLEYLREHDLFLHRICAAYSDGGGYWIARTRRELLKNIKSDIQRSVRIYRRTRGQRLLSYQAFAAHDLGSLRQTSLFDELNEAELWI